MDPELDTNRPVTTHRTMTGAKLSQDGHLFSLAHVYVGPDPSYVPDEPEATEVGEVIETPPDDGKSGVLARAAARLTEYAEPEDIGDVKKENSKAAAAERLAS